MFSVSKTHTNTVQFNTFAPTHEKCHVGEIELLDLGARQSSPSREIAPLGLTTTSTALKFWASRLLPSVVPTCVSLVRPPPSMNWQRRSTDSVGYASSSSSTRTFWAPIPAGRREGDKERERERLDIIIRWDNIVWIIQRVCLRLNSMRNLNKQRLMGRRLRGRDSENNEASEASRYDSVAQAKWLWSMFVSPTHLVSVRREDQPS